MIRPPDAPPEGLVPPAVPGSGDKALQTLAPAAASAPTRHDSLPAPRLVPLSGADAIVALAARRRRRLRILLGYALAISAALTIILAPFAVYEACTSRLQAKIFSRLARRIYFSVQPGPSDRIVFPGKGPSDLRRGYALLPAFGAALRAKGFRVASQARFSPEMLTLARRGIYPAYRDKTQAGLRLLDDQGRAMFAADYPLRIYPAFDSIPRQVANTLLFIENRSLLDTLRPYRNPAVEWSRLGKAVTELLRQKLGRDGNAAGGSTLATQMEKYRHSGDGRTQGAKEKALQMVSASLRVYQDGENTVAARKRILLDYVNSVPLAALPGYGEVNGLSDGLKAWYGASIDSVNRALMSPRGAGPGGGLDSGVDMRAMGRSYRRVLNLFIAHRRPSAYLLQNRDALGPEGAHYLRKLAQAGAISPQLRDAALQARPELMRRAATLFPADFVDRKHVDAVRTRLTSLLGLPRLYDLDRLDLTVGTTLDGKAQKEVVRFLKRLADPAFVDAEGLRAFRLLEKGDPAQVIYSFTLYETVGGKNLLRIQADNLDQPLNINGGVKLDLGSTAKLRTLVNYLEIISDLHARFAGMTAARLRTLAAAAPDRLTAWTASRLASAGDTSLAATLDAAVDREYSGDTRERFFTGGGVHRFVNFEGGENGVMTVREAFRKSVNLVFVRLMRDIVNYYGAQAPVPKARLLAAEDSPERRRYLALFAEQEGQLFLGRFYRKYRDMDRDDIMESFFHGLRPSPNRLAAAYLYLEPKADSAAFGNFIRDQLGDSLFPQKQIEQLYRRHWADSLNLADLGYVAGVHPLELWLAGYLRAHPRAPWSEVKAAGRGQIQETYQWLFKTRHKPAQDARIRSIVEMEAFLDIHRAWSRLGYPFGSLVPSFATAIGSSADRPDALAELVGILLNDGVRYQPVMINRLLFAENTPYQTLFTQNDTAGERLLSPQLCRTVRACMLGVVERGTAVRGYRAFPLGDGAWLPLGGKTGTGDHRFDTFGKGGRVIESRVVNRTATFVFFLGDRFFGTVTAHVHGEQARNYGFTSALPVQLLRLMGPSLMPLLLEKREPVGPDGVSPVFAPMRVRPASPALAGSVPASLRLPPILRSENRVRENRGAAAPAPAPVTARLLRPWYDRIGSEGAPGPGMAGPSPRRHGPPSGLPEDSVPSLP